jgi:hypothetical protein
MHSEESETGCSFFLSLISYPYSLLLLHLATLKDTYILGRNLLHEGSARQRDLYLTRHNIQKRETAMIPVGSETRKSSKRVVGDLHVLQRGHWNRQERGGEEDDLWLEDKV